jgi:dolichol-phosphate mannosyltransferase
MLLTGRRQSDRGASLPVTEISIVVPVYGCRDCLEELNRRLCESTSEITSDFQIVYVDDRSPDGAWETLCKLASADSRVVAIRLSRNFGQDAAITAGLARSNGRWTVVLDCDLEEPPEMIPRLYRRALDGYDIVQGVRVGWKHSRFRRLMSRLYRYLMLESDPRPRFSNLSILSRRVVDSFLTLGDREREYQLMLDWLGFSRATIPFEHQQRPVGRSAYTVRRLLRAAAAGMFFRTTVLLRWIVFLGFVIATAGVLLAGYLVYSYFASDTPKGYTSVVVLLLILVGFVIVSIGVVGLYVGRIFDQVKGRPLFVVEREVSGSDLSTVIDHAVEQRPVVR